jgi:hypothetical protein
MDYEIVEQTTWMSTLYNPDCESCFLSNVVPCHVYSKIMSTTKLEYTIRIILYIILYTGIEQLIYIKYKLDNSMCPPGLINNCILSDNCQESYMMIGDKSYSCRLLDGFCVYGEYQCNKDVDTSVIYLMTSFLYVIMTYIHYTARKHIMERKNIQQHCITDFCAITCCVPCGLAQEYRELP